MARCRMNDCRSFGLLPSPCCSGKSWMALVTRSLKLGVDGGNTVAGRGVCNSTAAGGLLGELGAGTGGEKARTGGLRWLSACVNG